MGEGSWWECLNVFLTIYEHLGKHRMVCVSILHLPLHARISQYHRASSLVNYSHRKIHLDAIIITSNNINCYFFMTRAKKIHLMQLSKSNDAYFSDNLAHVWHKKWIRFKKNKIPWKKISSARGVPKRSPIKVLTTPDVAWLRWSDENRYFQRGMAVDMSVSQLMFL